MPAALPDQLWLKVIYQHWRGQEPLRLSQWQYYLLPFLTLQLLQTMAVRQYASTDYIPQVITTIILLLGYLLWIGWLVTGYFRASARSSKDYGSQSDTTTALLLLFLLTAYIAIGMADVVSNTLIPPDKFRVASTGLQPVPQSLSMSQSTLDKSRGFINGVIGIGATRQMMQFIQQHPSIRHLTLTSPGGRVFEARGIGRLIMENGFTTHVDSECHSACTLAFVHGRQRTATSLASFGFHRYSYQAQHPEAYFNVQKEQQKDMDAFRTAGVTIDFLGNIQATAPEQLWKPTLPELLDSGFLNAIVASESPDREQ